MKSSRVGTAILAPESGVCVGALRVEVMQMRKIWQRSMMVLLCSGWPFAVSAAHDQAAALLSECSVPDLPAEAVDSCLERVRVLDETSPSPALQSLEARLDEQKSGKQTSGANGPPRALQPLQEETVPKTGAAPVNSEVTARGDRPVPAVGADEQTYPSSEEARSQDPYPAQPPAQPSQDSYGSVEGEQGSMNDVPPIADPPDNSAPGSPTDDPE